MKKRFGGVLIGICAGFMVVWANSASAQYSNEWINFTQSYYKIPVAKNGIYKISYADLQAAGVPIGSVDPRRINLFHRGSEQAIFVQGQADASFDAGDFIEFYGRRNDGTLDGDLYNPLTLQPHTYYNLFNDTTAYFLTWNSLPVQGKRMTLLSEPNVSGLPAETFHNEERLQVYSTDYSGGLTLGGEIQSTAFDLGEGWTGPVICKNLSGCTGQQDFLIDNLLRGVTSGGLPQLEVLLAGRDEVGHQVEVYAGADGGSLRLITSSAFFGFQTVTLTAPLNWSDIGAGGVMTVRVRLISSSRDQVSASYIKVNFPQNFNVTASSEKVFNLASNGSAKSYVEILNFPAGTRLWDITDPDNVGMIGTTSVPGGFGAIALGGSKLYTSSVALASTLQKVSFRSIAASIPDFIIISHRSLMKPALGYGDAVQSYAAYRASAAGGGYDTLTVPMDQLYNQFNYGETSPRAIYQFMKYLVNGGHPKFLFLIGKGLEVSQGFYRKTSFTSSDFRDLVPSAGMPGADVAFTAGLNGTTFQAGVATGRLTASTANQVASYLNKIKETDGLAFDDLWRKDLLHLSGGINAGEPQIFRGYVDGFKAISDTIYLGGRTETISKQTLNVELINVKDQVNKGLNLITFFGHSGPGTIDIDIGNVSDPTLGYNNAGKYPGFLINGCLAGRFFDNRVTFGEDWMLTANKGAKSFIAHSSFGFDNQLREYTTIFYSVAFGDSTFMRKGIGEVQKETSRRYLAAAGTDIITITQAQQMVLLGDPALSLFSASKPDYEINNGSIAVVSLDGVPVSALSEAFALDVNVKNFGRAQPGLMEIKITRTLSDNSVITYDSIVDPTLYSKTIRFVIKKGRSDAEFGINNFAVTIDPDNKITELNEGNNKASLNFFIPLNGTKNLFPSPYAITNTSAVNLVFQNTDLLADTRSYKIEIDTAATFDSPYLNRKVISGKVVMKMPVTVLTDDSLVYYWRTKIEKPLAGESDQWALSSFFFIKNGPEGWAQVKFPQFSEDKTTGLISDPELKRIKFQETVSTVDLKTFGDANATDFSQVSLKINGEEYNVATQELPCRDNSLNLIAFDKNSSAPYAGIPFISFFDSRACGRAPQMINNFVTSEMETGNGDDVIQWVANIHAGDSVVLYSIGDAGFASWSATLKVTLSALGIGTNQLNSLQPGEPFIIFGKKGSVAGSAKVFRASQSPANAQELAVNKTITGRYSEGTIASVVIGPAEQWVQMISQVTEATSNDQYGIQVTGIDLTGNESLIKTNLKGSVSFSDVDAAQFPYVRLTLSLNDFVDLTPVQLKKWLVTYKPMAEGLLNYSGSKGTETVQEGEGWSAKYGFTNISPRAFTDSLLVQVDVFSSDKKSTQRNLFKIKPPAPGDTSKFSVEVNTKGKAGSNDISVFVNPGIQPEMYYDNNVLALYSHLKVEADTRAPLLDVTIDGRRVMNGDAISASPVVLAKVVDHNQFLLKTDTVGINLFLQYPCALEDCPYTRINFSRPDVSWKPATATSDFQVMFQPKDLESGTYSLKAEAVDASGNVSGVEPYEVSFLVTDKNGFVFQSVYPNPSSDAFYFRFFLGGPMLPENFQLTIYSSTGSVIRNFGNEQLSVLHVGINEISVGASDATGNVLPTGIYLFRMTTLIGGMQFITSGKLMVVR